MAYGDLATIETDKGEVKGWPIQDPISEKIAVLRYPTNPELLAYYSAQRFIVTDLGRRKSKIDIVPSPKADLALFTACRLGKPEPEFDDADMAYALSILLDHRMVSCEKQGKAYLITLRVLDPTGESSGVTLTHLLSMPTRKSLSDYRSKRRVPISLPNNLEEIRLPPDVPAALYDLLLQSSTGYADGVDVPLHHKRTVINQLDEALALLDPAIDPNE